MNNRIKDLNKKYLQDLLDSSDSLAEVLIKIGMSVHGNNYKELNYRIKLDNLSLENLSKNKTNKIKKRATKIAIEDVLVNKSTYSRQSLKLRLVSDGLLPYRCEICFNEGVWNKNPLTLQLDHKNGVNTDNRLENLRFLCPNCHSQTDTYTGKNSKRTKKEWRCVCCGISISKGAEKCHSCASKDKESLYKFQVSKEDLQNLINTKSLESIGRLFSVSGNAIKKRCIKYGISKQSI
jgi:rubrerythrin